MITKFGKRPCEAICEVAKVETKRAKRAKKAKKRFLPFLPFLPFLFPLLRHLRRSNFFEFIMRLIFPDCRNMDNDPSGRRQSPRADRRFRASICPARLATVFSPSRTPPFPLRCRVARRLCADRKTPRPGACPWRV